MTAEALSGAGTEAPHASSVRQGARSTGNGGAPTGGSKSGANGVGVGGSVETADVRIPVFRLGSREFKNAQADLFLDGSPVDKPLIGHIGMGVLGKAAVIFDYSRKRLIIE